MSDTTPFDQCAAGIEERTSLDRLEARGTLRIALRDAGFDAASISPDQLRVVVTKVLPALLDARGVEAPATLCEGLASELDAGGEAAVGDTPDQVFARLGAR